MVDQVVCVVCFYVHLLDHAVILMTVLTDSGDDILFDFEEPAVSSAWRSMNDGVVDGASDGRFHIARCLP